MFASAASYVLIAAAALQPVLAGVYITSPVAGTPATGGQVLEVKWADDGKTPTVGSVGPCSVDIYTGSVNNQIKLQNLAASVDVSKTSSISATIDPSIGQDDSHYFVRFTSLSLKSESNPQYPYEAFSAMFTINSMTGKFDSATLAAIDAGNSTSSAASAAVSGAGSKTTAGLAASASAKSSASASASSKATSAALPLNEVLPAGMLLAAAGFVSYLVL
ncbi:uncharacterized protein I303_105365 [Kwoniella dejecticola CBS 10117]|uniref:Yeast cell wall synthesis Kre9/Knh1-like N-terminal domain-containing protein n=1 Tax=Kwoniella dejecticola CBS 10117 TaxID=1296121 RepID=A0A1A6A2P8_9TREE|nr:uncharacterized protein I303_05189 [Kwoniella dejecticola CBS 10117]OBR84331.1 hypothetical protein I303_05189 [Kwoniella dejecticola CBS 10117]